MDNILKKQVTLINELGLHARAAAAFVKKASEFKSDITICRNEIEINGKSILGILMLAVPRGESFDICAKGEDSHAALAALTELVNNRFGEKA